MPIGLVYSVLVIGRWGSTAGKALFELEVASYATGGRPTWREAISRQLWLIGPVIAGALLVRIVRATSAPSWVGTALGFVWLALIVALVAALLDAALRVPGKRARWDLRSGTVVRYRRSRQSVAL
jgi:hypothetical protein